MSNKKSEVMEKAHMEGVTLENCLRYINTIEEVVMRDIKSLPKEDRAVVLSAVVASLLISARILRNYRDKLVSEGEADELTEAEKNRFRLMINLTNRGIS